MVSNIKVTLINCLSVHKCLSFHLSSQTYFTRAKYSLAVLNYQAKKILFLHQFAMQVEPKPNHI